MIARAPFRWYGSKWRLYDFIAPHIPEHVSYIEPFAGSLCVLFRKAPSELEIINDLDCDVINFFQVLRDQPDELIRSIRLTPYARYELARADEFSRNGDAADPLERARRFYVLCNQGWGGKKHPGRRSWRYQVQNNRGKSVIADWNTTEHLYEIAGRLKHCFIEHDTAQAIISRYDNLTAFFYLDPPYLKTERKRPDHGYDHEMDTQQHEELLQQLLHLQGNAIISGYPSELYNDLLLPAGWAYLTATARTTNPGTMATEAIWVSPNAIRQPTLF